MNKHLDELTLLEAFIAVGYAISNLGKITKIFILNKIEQLFFCFKKPKYKKGQRIVLWETSYIIENYYRDWEWCRIFYNLEDCFTAPSESLLDFYMEKK